jgi:flagellar biosynthesis/type III secretory pathway chaperone
MTADAKKTEVKKIEPPKLKVNNIVTMTARLAQLLAEEADLLGAMKVSNIKSLQQEKLFLVNALDAQRKLLEKHPHLIETIPSQDKSDLKEVVEVFNNVLAENHRKLLIAKEVNHKIVQAITDIVMRNTRRMAYSDKGTTGIAPFETLSVTLNERI